MREEERLVGPYGTAPYNKLAYNETRIESTPLLITLNDNSKYYFTDILSRVMDYWRRSHFP
jgi:hypothetical protein